MLFRAWISGLMLLCFISPSTLGEVRLVDGWTRSPAPGVDRLAIYGRLVNEGGAPVVLSRWVLAGAAMIMFHETVMVAGQMRMRHLDPIELSPLTDLVMQPQGPHLMVVGLETLPKAGDTLTIDATTSLGETFTCLVQVQPITSLGPKLN